MKNVVIFHLCKKQVLSTVIKHTLSAIYHIFYCIYITVIIIIININHIIGFNYIKLVRIIISFYHIVVQIYNANFYFLEQKF